MNTINITRSGDRLKSVDIVVTLWEKDSQDGFLSVDIPVLNIKTYSDVVENVEKAAHEAIKLFFINCEAFGNGVEKELLSIGWTQTEKGDHSTTFEFKVKTTNINSVFDQMMETGETITETLEMEYA